MTLQELRTIAGKRGARITVLRLGDHRQAGYTITAIPKPGHLWRVSKTHVLVMDAWEGELSATFDRMAERIKQGVVRQEGIVIRKKKHKWLKCQECGRKDESTPGYTGTSEAMLCPDCANRTGHATLCRVCCPTGHGTRWEGETNFPRPRLVELAKEEGLDKGVARTVANACSAFDDIPDAPKAK